MKIIKSALAMLFAGSFLLVSAVQLEDARANPNDVLFSSYPELPSEMQTICREGDYELQANPSTAEFVVVNQKTGYRWYSNPPERSTDPYAKKDRSTMSSQLIVHFFNDDTGQEDWTNTNISAERTFRFTKEKNGFVISYDFEEEGFSVPLRIVLEDACLIAEVDTDGIVQTGNNRVSQISILPFFNAGGLEDQGYIVVPDGCGAIIDFNNNRQTYGVYNEKIYSVDYVLNGNNPLKRRENSALPLFGIVNNQGGFAAIITDGEANAGVIAGVSRKESGYNNAYAYFTLLVQGTYTIGGYFERDLVTLEQGKTKLERCRVKYYLLSEEEASYTGIARKYRSYLLNEIKVVPITRAFSVFLEVYGGVARKKSVLGFPVTVTQPLTTYSQAEKMVADLQELGVDNIILNYKNWNDDAIMGRANTNWKPSGSLGGKSGFSRLNRFLEKQNIPLVANINFNVLRRSGNGISTRSSVARLFTGLPGVRFSFKLHTQQMDADELPYFYLAPSLFKKTTGQLIRSAQKAGAKEIGLDTLGDAVYSDLNKKNGMSRQQMTEEAAQTAKSMRDAGLEVYTRVGNAYLLPYTSYIFDMPDDMSHNDIENRAVPLFALAVSGVIPYSLTDINGKSDPKLQLLKSIEMGADIKFTWIYEGIDKLSGTGHEYLYGSRYEPWIDFLREEYPNLAEVKQRLSGAHAVGHEILGDLRITEYSNGLLAVINYGEQAAKFQENIVPSKDFILIEGEAIHGD